MTSEPISTTGVFLNIFNSSTVSLAESSFEQVSATTLLNTDGELHSVTITNCHFSAGSVAYSYILWFNTSQVTIQDSTFTGVDGGVYIIAQTSVLISNTTFDSAVFDDENAYHFSINAFAGAVANLSDVTITSPTASVSLTQPMILINGFADVSVTNLRLESIMLTQPGLVFQGNGEVTIQDLEATDFESAPLLRLTDNNHTIAQNLKIENGASGVIGIHLDDGTNSNVTITNLTATNSTHPVKVGINSNLELVDSTFELFTIGLSGVGAISLQNCTFHNGSQAADLSESSNFTVRNSNFDQCSTGCIKMSNMTGYFFNTTFSACGGDVIGHTGGCLELYIGDGDSHATVVDCTFTTDEVTLGVVSLSAGIASFTGTHFEGPNSIRYEGANIHIDDCTFTQAELYISSNYHNASVTGSSFENTLVRVTDCEDVNIERSNFTLNSKVQVDSIDSVDISFCKFGTSDDHPVKVNNIQVDLNIIGNQFVDSSGGIYADTCDATTYIVDNYFQDIIDLAPIYTSSIQGTLLSIHNNTIRNANGPNALVLDTLYSGVSIIALNIYDSQFSDTAAVREVYSASSGEWTMQDSIIQNVTVDNSTLGTPCIIELHSYSVVSIKNCQFLQNHPNSGSVLTVINAAPPAEAGSTLTISNSQFTASPMETTTVRWLHSEFESLSITQVQLMSMWSCFETLSGKSVHIEALEIANCNSSPHILDLQAQTLFLSDIHIHDSMTDGNVLHVIQLDAQGTTNTLSQIQLLNNIANQLLVFEGAPTFQVETLESVNNSMEIMLNVSGVATSSVSISNGLFDQSQSRFIVASTGATTQVNLLNITFTSNASLEGAADVKYILSNITLPWGNAVVLADDLMPNLTAPRLLTDVSHFTFCSGNITIPPYFYYGAAHTIAVDPPILMVTSPLLNRTIQATEQGNVDQHWHQAYCPALTRIVVPPNVTVIYNGSLALNPTTPLELGTNSTLNVIGDITVESGTQISLPPTTTLIIDGALNIDGASQIVLQPSSVVQAQQIFLQNNASMTLQPQSELIVVNLTLENDSQVNTTSSAKLNITGTAQFNGKLTVSFPGLADPSRTDAETLHDIVFYGNRDGSFSQIEVTDPETGQSCPADGVYDAHSMAVSFLPCFAPKDQEGVVEPQLPVGAIIGGVVGGVVFVALVVALTVYLVKRHHYTKNRQEIQSRLKEVT